MTLSVESALNPHRPFACEVVQRFRCLLVETLVEVAVHINHSSHAHMSKTLRNHEFRLTVDVLDGDSERIGDLMDLCNEGVAIWEVELADLGLLDEAGTSGPK